MILSGLQQRPLTFDECIVWARKQFEEEYSNEIKQLLHSLPADLITREGVPFWSGPKRAPKPLTFDPNNVSLNKHALSLLRGADVSILA